MMTRFRIRSLNLLNALDSDVDCLLVVNTDAAPVLGSAPPAASVVFSVPLSSHWCASEKMMTSESEKARWI